VKIKNSRNLKNENKILSNQKTVERSLTQSEQKPFKQKRRNTLSNNQIILD
jgi:hypothetical protein